MKTIYLPVIAATALALAGCDNSEYSRASANSNIQKATNEQLNRDKEVALNLVKQMKSVDPEVFDAVFTLDERGKRIIEVYKNSGDNIEVMRIPADIVEKSEAEALQNKTPESQSSSGFAGGFTGALLGNMIGSSFNTSNIQRSNFDSYRGNRQSVYANSVAKTSRNLHNQRSQTSSVGRSRGGAFGGGGARGVSSGFGG